MKHSKIPIYNVINVKKYDQGLYRLYEEALSIDVNGVHLNEVMSHDQAKFVFPDGQELFLRIDCTTIDNHGCVVIIRQIYEKIEEEQ